MRRRCLLNAVACSPWAGFLVGLLWATTSGTISDRAQASAQPDSAKPPQGERQAAQDPAKKFPQGGVWHRFGERDNARAASASQLGVWHHFGPRQAASQVTPDAMAPQPNFGTNHMASLERQMRLLLNHDRLSLEAFAEKGGRAWPLKWNGSLAAVARAHSRSMLEQQFFSHVDTQGRTVSMRIDEAGIPWQAAGENIAIYDTVSGAESAFMNEPRFQHNHRANILNDAYTDVGIGIVQGPYGLYITQDFVEIPPERGAARSAPRPIYDRTGGSQPVPTAELLQQKGGIEKC